MACCSGGNDMDMKEKPAQTLPMAPPSIETPLSKEQEKEQVSPLLSQSLEEGKTFYIIEHKWLDNWKRYVQYESKEMGLSSHLYSSNINTERPGPIDNSSLQGDNPYVLKKFLTERLDYDIVSSEAWKLLLDWYGGGPSYPRIVNKYGYNYLRIDLYPPCLNVCWADRETGEPQTDKRFAIPMTSASSLSDVLLWAQNNYQQLLTEVKSQPKDESTPATSTSENEISPSTSQCPYEFRLWMPYYHDEWLTTKFPGYRLCDEKDLTINVDRYNQKDDEFLLIEYKKTDSPKWIRSTVTDDKPFVTFHGVEYRVGDYVDALDTSNKWYLSVILKIDENKGVFVHYFNWEDKWDAFLSEHELPFKIDKKGTHPECIAPHVRRQYSSSGGFYSGISGMGMGYSSYHYNHTDGAPSVEGAVGLRNLGNTCFMNSIISCMNHTPIIKEFFLDESFKEQINRDNPLGWKGKVAESWGELVKTYWSNKYSVVSPFNFKQSIGEFAPMFSGYQQQDSSELLSFLLDGLHEDLNRVLKKPMTSPVESKGRSDKVIADESWEVHQMRNRSLIVDNFQGQFKSRVVCPMCQRVSVTFDPFMFLSIPVPTANDKIQEVTLVRDGPELHITRYGINVPRYGAISDLKREVSKICSISDKNLTLCDVFNHRIHSILEDHGSIGDITARDDIWAFENKVPFDRQNYMVRVLMTRKHQTSYYQHSFSTNEQFGVPCVLILPRRKYTQKELAGHVHSLMTKYLVGNISDRSQAYSIIITDSYGHRCGKCPWNYQNSCDGCVLEETDEILEIESQMNQYHTNIIAFSILWTDSKYYNLDKVENPQVHKSASSSSTSNQMMAFERRTSLNTNLSYQLADCLDSFTQEDILSENDAWYCNVCKKHQCASKKMILWRMPDVLIIHLKRFMYTRMHRDKIGSLVEFPLDELDLSNWTANEEEFPCLYNLYAVSNHMGGLGGGHYTAYVKNLTNNQWYCHDDSSVSPVNNIQSIMSSNAYLLFYLRKKIEKTEKTKE